jgi:predicted nuclease of predicted toxin-antitoxin system
MSGRVRFQADEDLEPSIINGLRRRQPLIEFGTIPAAGLLGAPDPVILAFASQQGRVIVSHDLRTMPTHFADFLASGQHSAELILISRKLPIAQVIDNLYLIWDNTTLDFWIDRLAYLPMRSF